jgi:hypothetical protein
MYSAVCRLGLVVAILSCTSRLAAAPQEEARSSSVPSVETSEPKAVLQRFETYHIRSKTIYMKREVLLKACQERAEFSAWKLTPAEDPASADVIIEVTLPFLTWEWNYKLLHRESGRVLASGKVSALEQHQAAPLLAADLVKAIAASREIPDTRKPQPTAQNKVAGLKSWHVKGKGPAASGDLTMAIGENAVYISDSSGKQA